MQIAKRYSPIVFKAAARHTENRAGWEVVVRYEGEDSGPVLVDLSHRGKWDIQDRNLDNLRPGGFTIPGAPGGSIFETGLLVSRMNRTQAAVWHLGEKDVQPPAGPGVTETTDAQALVALVGEQVTGLMEKVSRLDLSPPGHAAPCLLQGPMLDIPCQIVPMGQAAGTTAVLIAFSRGYGQAAADALLAICRPEGLRPGGEGVFSAWIKAWTA